MPHPATDGPLLRTQRLELWRPQASDLADLFALTFDPDSRRFLGSTEPSESDSFARLLRNAGSWALYGYGVFAVRLAGEAEIAATCGVFRSYRGFGPAAGLDDVAEAGWIVRRDLWGRGIASEAMIAALDWFDTTHGAQRIACMIETGNIASVRVARHLGFREYARRVDEEKELVLYERL